ncbi:MAG: hypothetical protein LBB41_06685 [Prevotellaceae bacterium]|jgi:hypothetical protein|nr:hypothetical protein [Prevotellaceae bacterium]
MSKKHGKERMRVAGAQDKIIALRSKGSSWRKIAEAVNIHYSVLYYYKWFLE